MNNFNIFDSKNVLIIGGAGFIGSHIADSLLNLGANVSIFDNFSACNFDNLKHLISNKHVEIITGDINDQRLLESAVKNKNYVFHLAALLGVTNAVRNPATIMNVDLGSISTILELSRKFDVDRIIYSSSSEVYGEPESIPITEDYEKKPLSTYAISKLGGEEFCNAYYSQYGLKSSIVRYFNIYGPYQDERFVIPKFINSALSNSPLQIFGDGNQTRDFTYISDAVNCTLLCAVKKEAVGQAFNVSTGRGITISALADSIIKVTGSKSKIEYIPFNEDRPKIIEIIHRVADNSKAVKLLDFNVEITFEEGLLKTINWFRSFKKTIVCSLIPAHNEGKNIYDVIRNIPSNIVDEVVVVDDGSKDETFAIANKAGAKVLKHEFNKGVGAAFKTGFDYVVNSKKADILVTLDADGQHDPREIPKLVEPIVRGDADMVIGSRLKEYSGGMPLKRLIGNKIISGSIRAALGKNLTDVTSGYRAISIEALNKLGYKSFSDDFKCITEMLSAAVSTNLRIVEVPIRTIYSDDTPSHVKPFKDSIRFLSIIPDYYKHKFLRTKK